MKSKSFSYKQITAKAEERISHFMRVASEHRDTELKQLYRDWAYGVFLGWRDLVMGWCQDGDVDRLEALTKEPQS